MAQTLIEHIYHLKGGEQEAVEYQNPFLERREPIVVYCKDGITRLKVGDGKHYYNELDFITNVAIDVNDVEGLQNILDEIGAQIKIAEDDVTELKDFVETNCVTKDSLHDKVEELRGTLDTYIEENYLNKNEIEENYATKNSLVGKKTPNGGVIFNDYDNNKATGELSAAFGMKTKAGSGVFKILGDNKENLTITLDSVEGLEVGLECSCQYENNFIQFGKIVAIDIDNKIVTFDNIPTDTYQTDKTNYLWVPSKPELGNGENFIGTGAFAAGYQNTANTVGSAAFGYNNTAAGKYAFLNGTSNTGGYGCLVGGKNNLILGIDSFGFGVDNIISNQVGSSAVLGYSNEILKGQRHFVVGNDNNINGSVDPDLMGDFVCGSQNKVGGGNYNIIGGYDNTVQDGDYGIILGQSNNVSLTGNSNIINGNSNIINTTKTTNNNIISGNDNKILGAGSRNNNIISGNANQILSAKNVSGCLIIGSNNIIPEDTGFNVEFSIISGLKNTVDTKYSSVCGESNNVRSIRSVICGKGNVTPNNGSDMIVAGQFAKISSSTRFAIGNGTDKDNLSNAFEVRKDGTMILNGQSFTAKQLNNKADKSYVDNKITNIENKLNNGLVLTDNITNINYRVYVENGKLQLEEVTE